MDLPNKTRNPLADWRKYPKGPNFYGIVAGASVILVVLMIAAWLLVRADAGKMLPHGANPEPNSLILPLMPPASQIISA